MLLFLIIILFYVDSAKEKYNTPPTESMSGLQPNTPQPLAPSVPPLRKAGCC